MKILYYSPHPMLSTDHKAGYATHINEMIHAFRELRHEVVPVIMGGLEEKAAEPTIKSTSGTKQTLKKIMPKILWESMKDYKLSQFDKSAERVLKKAIITHEPDLIYERANYFQTSGVNTAKYFGIKHILEVNSPYPEERTDLQGPTLFHKKSNRLERLQLEHTDKIVVVSSALKTHFVNKHKINPNKIIVVPNAVNPASVNLDAKKITELTEIHKNNEELIIGFVGSFFRWHGIDKLIKAYGRVYKNYPNTKLMIVGSGEIERELKQLAKQTAPENIIFTGQIPQKDIFNYISLFDIAVSPNAGWYQSPIKIFEYGALGKAIIAPDNEPLNETIENGKEGLLIKPNKESLYNALETLITNRELRIEIGENFRKKIREQFTWDKNVEKITTYLHNENLTC